MCPHFSSVPQFFFQFNQINSILQQILIALKNQFSLYKYTVPQIKGLNYMLYSYETKIYRVHSAVQGMLEGIVGGQYTKKSKLHSCRNQVETELGIYLISFGHEFFVFCLPPKNIQIKLYRSITLPAVLCAGETWSFTLQEKQMLKVFESRVIRTTLVKCWQLQNQKHHQVLLKVTVKVKFTLELATKVQRGSRGIALLFL